MEHVCLKEGGDKCRESAAGDLTCYENCGPWPLTLNLFRHSLSKRESDLLANTYIEVNQQEGLAFRIREV